MPGLVTNQFETDSVTRPKIADLDAPLLYTGSAALSSSITQDGHVAHKAYVDSVVAGVDVGASARVSTVENLFANTTGSGVGKQIVNQDTTFPALTVDGITPLSVGDRVLVKNLGGEVFAFTLDTAESPNNYRYTSAANNFGRFWEFNANGIDYYVWYDVTADGHLDPGGATQPDAADRPTASATGIQVVDIDGLTATAIADKTVTAIVTALGTEAANVVNLSSGTVHVTLNTEGNDALVNNGNGTSALTDVPGTPNITINQAASGSPATGCLHNGMYYLSQTDDPGAAPNTQNWILTRATTDDQTVEVSTGKFYFTEQGTINNGSAFVLITTGVITVDTTAQLYTLYSTSGNIIAGDGIDKTGQTLSVNVDDSTLEVASDLVIVKAGGMVQAKLANSAVGPFQLNDGWTANYGVWVEDNPTRISFPGASRPNFSSSVDVTDSEAAAPDVFSPGDLIEQADDTTITGIFMGFDDNTTPTKMFYLPTSDHTATDKDFGDTKTIRKVGAASTNITTEAAANDSAATGGGDESPDGTVKIFSLSNALEGTSYQVLSSSVEVWRNGALQKRVQNTGGQRAGVDAYWFNTTNDTINFGTAPAQGDELIGRWVPQPV